MQTNKHLNKQEATVIQAHKHFGTIMRKSHSGFHHNSYLKSNDLTLVDSVQPRDSELLGTF